MLVGVQQKITILKATDTSYTLPSTFLINVNSCKHLATTFHIRTKAINSWQHVRDDEHNKLDQSKSNNCMIALQYANGARLFHTTIFAITAIKELESLFLLLPEAVLTSYNTSLSNAYCTSKASDRITTSDIHTLKL